ncbi:MAG: hypothetical protein OXG72_05530 [Acidobacteria bacterium]|nr:hypothetical protein [Acidobacteriota bacterium]
MHERLLEFILTESNWPATSIVLAGFMSAAWVLRQRRQGLPPRLQIPGALNLLYGGLIGFMAFGHLLAVTVELAQGTLDGVLWLLYPIGLILAVPAGWLLIAVRDLPSDERSARRKILVLNAWLGVSLLAMGVHNLPLALPAALNVAYLQLQSKTQVGFTVVVVTAVGYLALLSGFLAFFASGGSFEQFEGLE